MRTKCHFLLNIAWIYLFEFTRLMLCLQVFSGNTYKEQDLPVRHVFIRAFYTRYVKFHVTRWATSMHTLSLRVEIYGKRTGKNLNSDMINHSRFLKRRMLLTLSYRRQCFLKFVIDYFYFFGITCSDPQFFSPIKWTSCLWLRTPPSVLRVPDIRWHHRIAYSAATRLGVPSSMTIRNTLKSTSSETATSQRSLRKEL